MYACQSGARSHDTPYGDLFPLKLHASQCHETGLQVSVLLQLWLEMTANNETCQWSCSKRSATRQIVLYQQAFVLHILSAHMFTLGTAET